MKLKKLITLAISCFFLFGCNIQFVNSDSSGSSTNTLSATSSSESISSSESTSSSEGTSSSESSISPSSESSSQGDYLYLIEDDLIDIKIGDEYQLNYQISPGLEATLSFSSNNSCATVNDSGVIHGVSVGQATITLSSLNYTDSILVCVSEASLPPQSVTISLDKTAIFLDEVAKLSHTTTPLDASQEIRYTAIQGSYAVSINGNLVTPRAEGEAVIVGVIQGVKSNSVTLTVMERIEDPYLNVSYDEFYQDYHPAVTYMDSYYRTLHGFMSGSIEEQDQRPSTAANQPKQDGLLLRNTNGHYSDDKNTYFVYDTEGNIVNQIYKGAGYVTLEEVAAYVFAFGDIPANYDESKNARPTNSVWKEYLRLNHSSFTGNPNRYPYQPVLPDIRGCGGETYYFEIDIGTTGTDCDPNYTPRVYNNGSSITRGAARIVYTRFDKNLDPIQDINQRYVFYTYNHYNDFQEYLNYQGGWGEIFGNITGGGEISSTSNYNPTPYVETVRVYFPSLSNQNRFMLYYVAFKNEVLK